MTTSSRSDFRSTVVGFLILAHFLIFRLSTFPATSIPRLLILSSSSKRTSPWQYLSTTQQRATGGDAYTRAVMIMALRAAPRTLCRRTRGWRPSFFFSTAATARGRYATVPPPTTTGGGGGGAPPGAPPALFGAPPSCGPPPLVGGPRPPGARGAPPPPLLLPTGARAQPSL